MKIGRTVEVNNIDDHLVDNEDKNLEESTELIELTEKLPAARAERDRAKDKLYTLEHQYDQLLNSKFWKLIRTPQLVKSFFRSTVAYLLGRRNRKQLYSRDYKRKNAENAIKPYKKYLYNFGFIDRTIADLEKIYQETTNLYMKQAIAWELGLWYANKYTKEGAKEALNYLKLVVKENPNKDRLRQATIIQSECYDLLNEQETGKNLIFPLLEKSHHPDLYLAVANLQPNIEEKLPWINKALNMYGIQPIGFGGMKNPGYNDLVTLGDKKELESIPKVTVIIPSYNAEEGIGTAIESILAQTWANLEVLIVDDGSTDSTVSIIQSYVETDNRVRLYSTPTNSGPYIARNIALQNATGDFVTVNDADDWSHAEKIEIQATYLRDNNEVIATTSEHARLTEELKFYRRGTPGTYVFSNMSSLMFKRKPVLKKVGFWDSIRFAADSEFKRRIIAAFGQKSVVDLNTGPLSFPLQSIGSLTGNSSFGYNGFLMGVRKEYAEAHRESHKKADDFYYSYPQSVRPFPVPEPMWPEREKKNKGARQFDVIILSDFRLPKELLHTTIEEINLQKKKGLRTGLVQKSCYNFKLPLLINNQIRELVDGDKVQLLHYGEKVKSELLIIKYPFIFDEIEKFLPEIRTNSVLVMLDPASERQIVPHYDVRHFSRNIAEYIGKTGKWYPINKKARNDLTEQPHLHSVKLSIENWIGTNNSNSEAHVERLENWLVCNKIELGGSDDVEKL